MDEGFVTIIEPEVDIHCKTKSETEVILLEFLCAELNNLHNDDRIIFKLTLPDLPNFYQDLCKEEKVLRVVALSGGYAQNVANEKLSKNNGVIASFSRALTESLYVKMTDKTFTETIEMAIDNIYNASIT